MKRLTAVLVVLYTGLAFANSTPQQYLQDLSKLPMHERQNAVDRFLGDFPTNPVLTDSDSVLMVYVGPGRELHLVGDFTDWQPRIAMTHVPGTDLWYHAMDLPPESRLDYKFTRDGSWILDPRNPLTCTGGFGPNSELRGRDYETPAFMKTVSTSVCRLDTLHVPTPQLGGSREVVVVTPPGADGPERRYLLVHDGLEYIALADLVKALAWLSAGPAMLPICVCVPPVRRTEEYATDLQDDFGRFIVDSLIPQIEKRYGERGPWGSMGASYGGEISLYLARRYPEHFDRVAVMSPAIAPAQHQGVEVLDPASLKLYVNWGIYDIQPLIPACEGFVNILKEKGFEHMVEVKPQGHSWGFWRDSLIPALRYLYAP